MSKTVLVVDDYEGVLSLYTAALTRRGYKVVTAMTAEDALDKAAVSPPDLVVMDVNLPGMDGLAAAFRLRSTPETRDIPILAISGQAANEVREEAIQLGCIDFLQKPFPLSRLIGEVDRVLWERSMRGA